MGKPSDHEAGPHDLSLHSNVGQSSTRLYRDDGDDDDEQPFLDAPEPAIDDLPPNYSDAVEASGASFAPPTAPAMAPRPNIGDASFFVKDARTGALRWVSRPLEDPARLEAHIEQLAALPPRPFVRLVGRHEEAPRYSKLETERRDVTDFDVWVELTPYLYADATHRRGWRELRTVENGEKARRGTVLRRRAPGAARRAAHGLEAGAPPKPTLREWCHMYSASPAGLKVFALRRRMVGFNEALVKRRLQTLVRDTNYRGHLTVSLVTEDALVEVYNEARTNRWRLTAWVWWVFTLTLLFLFSWPYLWLRTKRWEVVSADWHFSRTDGAGAKQYVTISEEQWYNLWGRAICKAVLKRRRGMLDQSDLRRAQEPDPTFVSGNAAVGEAVDTFLASIHAMNEVNRHLGWGGDC
ncbi:hypothetical protein GGS23DRAFT_616628 [Durotheca rogersii]|uniref:uncharacterized protein n=1 Tax=Durotheca rogersii TaxID=419775 RepID=UPI00221F1423|nr:uncharacterized protein GGS23DRAFT_616628 [Durotheca rogersii]KAI5857462.1 hypothetical protein GGS23DRAFT_616628 [Durotheca rogersii]